MCVREKLDDKKKCMTPNRFFCFFFSFWWNEFECFVGVQAMRFCLLFMVFCVCSWWLIWHLDESNECECDGFCFVYICAPKTKKHCAVIILLYATCSWLACWRMQHVSGWHIFHLFAFCVTIKLDLVLYLPPWQFDLKLDLRHCCVLFHDAFQQRRDSPYRLTQLCIVYQ